MTIGKKIMNYLFNVVGEKTLENFGIKKFDLGQKLRFGLTYGMIRTKGCVIENAILYNEKGEREGCLDLLEEDIEKIATDLNEKELIRIYLGTDHTEDTSEINRLAYLLKRNEVLIVSRKEGKEFDDFKAKSARFPILSKKTSINIKFITLAEAKVIIEGTIGK
ncbi:MAG: hypothetical protein WC788_03530 [Candidatus Paceibacterota bacterium]